MKQILARAPGPLEPSEIRRLLCLAACLGAMGAGFAVPAALASSGGTGLPTTGTTTPTTTTTTTPGAVAPPPVVGAGQAIRPFQGRGMWIWMLSSSNGGNLGSIVTQAKTHGIHTLLIKSSDGTSMWSQFNPTVVSTLHHAGLRVCAWQYVYGTHPVIEAKLGARAAHDGANCLVIDAEVEYQGKYVQAQTYMRTLRRLVGYRFPVALAGFPYVDYHPSFPYSVFLGPRGAQVNAPQMYWRDIGTTVDGVFAHTYEWNGIYQRPIAPLGQIYGNPPLHQITRFRSISRYYRSAGVSWWDWQSAGAAQFEAVSKAVGRIPGFVAQREAVTISHGARGDYVVWAQEHLVSAGDRVTIDGDYGPATTTAVQDFQTAHGLPVTGSIDAETWDVLLRYRTANVTWVIRRHRLQATVTRGGTRYVAVPKSASLPERRDELAGAGGRGRPSSRAQR